MITTNQFDCKAAINQIEAQIDEMSSIMADYALEAERMAEDIDDMMSDEDDAKLQAKADELKTRLEFYLRLLNS